MMKPLDIKQYNSWVKLLTAISVATVLYSCANSSATPGMPQQPPPALPVVPVTTANATTFREYPASLEGKVNVEIRPQVEGYLEQIFVDEGAYVKIGQPLFKIDPRTYNESLNNAKSTLLAAQANVSKAQVEIDRLTPLVEHNVISDVQLKTAKAAYDANVAAVKQAEAAVANAQINVGYTLVKASANGYIGRIPSKKGALVGKDDVLTVLSDISEMYAYFSLSEPDFLSFKNQFAGNSIEEKVKHVPAVELALADNSIFGSKGRISTVEGQFDKTTGAISFRATFPNPGGILRTGNTGKVRIPQQFTDAMIVPIESTFEVQDKVFVFTVGDSNKVASKPITVTGKTTNYYFVKDGVKAGDKIVFAGAGNLQDGVAIVPQPISADSLLKAKPL
ncbi:efflux RND transporter periplasmic adaptor subunit [Niastella yeongjuensis]|nr:efflux RND transporter periplasmic adaptor subunit [Niastella yeongjuensis]SEP39448.1 membrane fusion protein, multidrug efflux system [Niastella yeongjuensis]